eukprot:g8392.t1
MHDTFTNIVSVMDGVDIDNIPSFLEVQDMQGMSTEQYATHEIKEIHKSLKEGFSFKESPIINDLKNLKEVPEGKKLSPSELKEHREEISVLLEKAMSMKMESSLLVLEVPEVQGDCKRTNVFSTCNTHSECRSDKNNPCEGECMCDTDGINECKCVEKGTVERLREKEELSKVDTGKILDSEKTIEKALTIKGSIAAAIFGFFDGFFSGMASEIRTAFEDPTCKNTNIGEKLKTVLQKLKFMWNTMKKIHRKVWTDTGRNHLIKSIQLFVIALIDFVKESKLYISGCAGMKMIKSTINMILGLLLFNIILLKLGMIVIPLILKYAGIILGLFFSFKYMKDKVISLYKRTKKIKNKSCNYDCKIGTIEDSFGIVGAIAEIVLLSGLDKVLQIDADVAKPIFKKFNVKFHPNFKNDMKVLKNAATKCKSGVKKFFGILTNKDAKTQFLKKHNLKNKITTMEDVPRYQRDRKELEIFQNQDVRIKKKDFADFMDKCKTLKVKCLTSVSPDDQFTEFQQFSPQTRRNFFEKIELKSTGHSKKFRKENWNLKYYEDHFQKPEWKARAIDCPACDAKSLEFINKEESEWVTEAMNTWNAEYWAKKSIKLDSNLRLKNEKFGLAYTLAFGKYQILKGTKYVTINKAKTNFITPKNKTEKSVMWVAIENVLKLKKNINVRRKLLSEPNYEERNYEAEWEEFLTYVEGGTKICKDDGNGNTVLSHVHVDPNGIFKFSCSVSEQLCVCIHAIGEAMIAEQTFRAGNVKLTVFRNEKGFASFEILEGKTPIGYGDVNDGDVENALGRRRRRLFQSVGNGGSGC